MPMLVCYEESQLVSMTSSAIILEKPIIGRTHLIQSFTRKLGNKPAQAMAHPRSTEKTASQRSALSSPVMKVQMKVVTCQMIFLKSLRQSLTTKTISRRSIVTMKLPQSIHQVIKVILVQRVYKNN
jgi:hypothetical protein